MELFYEEPRIRLYRGDARNWNGLLYPFVSDAIITDPVWPNTKVDLRGVEDPAELLRQTLYLYATTTKRIVIQLGCDSDPRFLKAVPPSFKFFRSCFLEYVVAARKGRLLYTNDVAYVFGIPPKSKKGARVLPGKCLSTKSDRMFEVGNGRNKTHSRSESWLMHPCPRRLQHVEWLVKWFGGESIVDPFCGSGTTLLAAKRAGIEAVGIEVEPAFCELAVRRLKKADAHASL